MRDIHFSFARGVWSFVFGGVCGGFWHTPHSAMMVMIKIGISYDSAAIGCVLRWTRDYKQMYETVFWAEIRYKTLSLAYASKHMCKVRVFVPFFFRLFLRARKAMMMKTI